MTEQLVKLEDVRAAKFCSSGMRVWFTHHGFDLSRFLREGIPAAEFEATGDALALELVRVARLRSTDGR